MPTMNNSITILKCNFTTKTDIVLKNSQTLYTTFPISACTSLVGNGRQRYYLKKKNPVQSNVPAPIVQSTIPQNEKLLVC